MSLKIYKRGKFWHYTGTVAGERLRGTTGTKEKERAQRITAQTEANAWNRHLDGPGAHVTMAQAFIAYREAGKSVRFLEPIENHWRDTLIRNVSPEAIRQSARLLYPKVKNSTRNRQVIAPTQAAINYAAGLYGFAKIEVKRFDIEPATRPAADLEWVCAFARQAVADGLPHLAALCLFMFGTGARIGEAVRMVWDDLDLTRKTAILRGNKPTPWERVAYLPGPVFDAIANLKSNRQPDAPVFNYAAPDSVKHTWDNAVKRAGIERMTPHSCRHGFATTMMREGIDVATIAKRGGWKDAATVLKYYAHAREDLTVTDCLFDTNATQAGGDTNATIRIERTI